MAPTSASASSIQAAAAANAAAAVATEMILSRPPGSVDHWPNTPTARPGDLPAATRDKRTSLAVAAAVTMAEK